MLSVDNVYSNRNNIVYQMSSLHTSKSVKKLAQASRMNYFRAQSQNFIEVNKLAHAKAQMQKRLVLDLTKQQIQIDNLLREKNRIYLNTGSLNQSNFDEIIKPKNFVKMTQNPNTLFKELLPLSMEQLKKSDAEVLENNNNENKKQEADRINTLNKRKSISAMSASCLSKRSLSRIDTKARSKSSYRSIKNVDLSSEVDEDGEFFLHKSYTTLYLSETELRMLSRAKEIEPYFRLDKIFSKRYKQLQISKRQEEPVIFDPNDFNLNLNSRLPRWKIDNDKQKIIEELQKMNARDAELKRARLSNLIKLKVKDFVDKL